MNQVIELTQIVPKEEKEIDWSLIEESMLKDWINQLKETPQNPFYHGEGEAWTHTRMVCEELLGLEEYQKLDKQSREALFLTALFHDFGKIFTTKQEENRIVSPGHAPKGATIVRNLLWKNFNLNGSKKSQSLRETICLLTKYHSIPVYLFDRPDPERLLARIASNEHLIPDFSIKKLCLLSEADIRGRITSVKKEALDSIELCRELAREIGCYDNPISFPNNFSEHAYLNGRNILPGQELYDPTWGPVILLSGLPASGKDTWIKNNYPGLPIISLDKLREEFNIKPTDNQGKVLNEAKERARILLRARQPFVWNATNLSPRIREKQLKLFKSYKASTRIEYLESDFKTLLERNENRKDRVPPNTIKRMLRNLIPPEHFESEEVYWELN